jgi:bacillolysin
VPPVNAADSTVFTYYSTQNGNFFLGRREAALGDPVFGTSLGNSAMSPSRPSVTGDGKLAFFVNSAKDACFIATNSGLGGVPSCIRFPGQIYSVSMSPSGTLYGFVLLNSLGYPDNRIVIVDLAANTSGTVKLIAPSNDGASESVLYAEAMAFTANGRYLIYDALTVVRFSDGSQIGLWAVYAIDFSSGRTLALLPPTLGYDLGIPPWGI